MWEMINHNIIIIMNRWIDWQQVFRSPFPSDPSKGRSRLWNSCGGLTSDVARLAQRDIPRIAPTNFTPPFHLRASRRRGGTSLPRARNPYPVDTRPPPLRSHTSHYKNYTGRWFSVLRRFTVVYEGVEGIRGKGGGGGGGGRREIEGGEQGAARVRGAE